MYMYLIWYVYHNFINFHWILATKKKDDKKKKSGDESSEFDSDLEKDIEKLSKSPVKSSKSRTTRSSVKSEDTSKKSEASGNVYIKFTIIHIFKLHRCNVLFKVINLKMKLLFWDFLLSIIKDKKKSVKKKDEKGKDNSSEEDATEEESDNTELDDPEGEIDMVF